MKIDTLGYITVGKSATMAKMFYPLPSICFVWYHKYFSDGILLQMDLNWLVFDFCVRILE